MVATASAPRRWWRSLSREAQALWSAARPAPKPSPGLYTYRFTPPGGRVRVHLRLEADGSGVLFVDVSEVVHLNPTAAEMAKMALEDVSLSAARGVFLGRHRRVDAGKLDTELAQIYAMVLRFREPGDGCPTCALPDLQRAPAFSTAVRAPYKADLALTYACNNDCPHCYNEPDRLSMPSLPLDGWRRIVDRLTAVGVPHLILTGGEATLHPDLPAIIRHADGNGHIVGLNTNGRRISHPEYLRELEDAGLNHVQITLGSNRPEVHDAIMQAHSFPQTVKGLENAVASGLHAITNTTLMRVNQDHVEEIIDFLHDRGIRTFAMNGMIYSGGGFADPNAIPEQEMPALLLRVRDHARERGMRFLWYTPTEYCRMSPVELEIGAKRCNAGEYSLCVEPNGDVLPCQSYYVAAGNLLRDPWEAIWNGSLFRSFRDRESDPKKYGLPEKCWECPDLPLCGGGCRIEREAREGRRTAGEGGGCSGCGTRRQETGSFIPLPSLASTRVRAAGFDSERLLQLTGGPTHG